MEIMHGNPDRTKNQVVTVATADGKFRYRVEMDYAKGLPDLYRYTPYMGNVSGGCVDAEDNLYCGLRGSASITQWPIPATILKFDPEGNFLEAIGAGKIPLMHFMDFRAKDRLILAATGANYYVEIDTTTGETVRTYGTPNPHPENGVNKDTYLETRLHRGIYPTEPNHGYGGGVYEWKVQRDNMQLSEGFHNPCDVAFDSQGNIYFADGYSNCAVHKYSPDGQHIKTWGGYGVFDGETDTPGRFLVVHAICIDKHDHVWICDRDKDAIHVFDTEGNLLHYISHDLGQPSGIGTDGEYVYAVGRGGYLTIFDFDFHIVGELGFFNGNLRAHDLCADSRGNLYLFPTHANNDHQFIALKRIR